MNCKTIGYKLSIYGDFKLTWAASSKRGKRKATKWRRILTKVWPKFGRIVTCCRAEPSRILGWILRPNLFAELCPSPIGLI